MPPPGEGQEWSTHEHASNLRCSAHYSDEPASSWENGHKTAVLGNLAKEKSYIGSLHVYVAILISLKCPGVSGLTLPI